MYRYYRYLPMYNSAYIIYTLSTSLSYNDNINYNIVLDRLFIFKQFNK